jgi:hypothetical protein
MRRMQLVRYLECPECALPIPLLASMHPEKHGDLSWWPTDIQPLNFLGLFCRHMFAYKILDVLMPTPEMMDQPELDEYLGVFCTQMQCGAESCEALARIYAVAKGREDDPTSIEDLREWQGRLSKAIPRTCFCLDPYDQHLLTKTTFRNGDFSDPCFVAPVCVP